MGICGRKFHAASVCSTSPSLTPQHAVKLLGRAASFTDGDPLALSLAGTQQHKVRLARIAVTDKSLAVGQAARMNVATLALNALPNLNGKERPLSSPYRKGQCYRTSKHENERFWYGFQISMPMNKPVSTGRAVMRT